MRYIKKPYDRIIAEATRKGARVIENTVYGKFDVTAVGKTSRLSFSASLVTPE